MIGLLFFIYAIIGMQVSCPFLLIQDHNGYLHHVARTVDLSSCFLCISRVAKIDDKANTSSLQLFGKVAINQGELDPDREGSDIWSQMTTRNNFRSFFPSIQVLFRLIHAAFFQSKMVTK
jgi:hypothetical protein